MITIEKEVAKLRQKIKDELLDDGMSVNQQMVDDVAVMVIDRFINRKQKMKEFILNAKNNI